MAHLYIIRGLPGSGKSTLAQRLLNCRAINTFIEADQFFTGHSGTYTFVPSKLKEAHDWCKSRVEMYLAHQENVAVSNTFSRIWEMQPYIDYCKENGHTFTVITCEGNYGNIHDVPPETIERMKQRWEKYE